MKAYHSHFSIHEATNKTIVISGNFSCSTDLVNFGPNNQNQQNKDKQSWKGWIQLGTSTSEITLVLQGRSCWTLVEKPQFYNVAERWKYYSKFIFFLFSLLYVSLSFNCYYLVSMCEKNIVGPHIMGPQIRHLWPRWPSPNILACLNLNLTQWHFSR